MRNLLRGLLFTILLSGGVVQAQQDYRPFRFFDPSLNNRPDISSLISSLRVRVPGHRPFSPLSTSGAQLFFFPEVASLMAALAGEGSRANMVPPPLFPPYLCESHKAFRESFVPALRDNSRRCRDLRDQYLANARNSVATCANVEKPEGFVYRHNPNNMSMWYFNDIESMIAVAGRGLVEVPTPAALRSESLLYRIRTILLKMQAANQIQKLNQIRLTFHNLISSLASHDSCFQEGTSRLSVYSWAMVQEVEHAQQILHRLETESLFQANADRMRVLNTGRARNPLPYPLLTDEDREWTSMLLGALYWRMRGGGVVSEPEGTNLTRIYFTMMAMGTIGWMNGWEMGQQAGASLYSGLFKQWGIWMDMGRTPGQSDRYHDLVHMTDRGRYQVEWATPTLNQYGFQTEPLLAGGMMMGPCYYYAWDKLGSLFWGPQRSAPFAPIVDGPTAWGELCAGASIGLGLSRSLLNGFSSMRPWDNN